METGHSKQELKPNSLWRALSFSSRLKT